MALVDGVGTVATQFFTFGSPGDPVILQSGTTLDEVTIAYETYGELNAERNNAVFIFHALTGSQHAAGFNPSVPGVGRRWNDKLQTGWWDEFIGPGRAVDTDHFFVICANNLGSCYGSTGPASIDPATGKPYGAAFPKITFDDMVDIQTMLLDHLGIPRLHAVIGGSTGAFMCLSMAVRYPDLVDIVIPIAGGAAVTALQKIYNFEQITAIENDPNFNRGDYYGGEAPNRGLMLARMIGHKTFVSLGAMERRARNDIVHRDKGPGTYRIAHHIESYMWHQGTEFVERFDANSYLRVMEAWQSFDIRRSAAVDELADAFTACKHQRYMIFSIDSDVCFYPEEQETLARALETAHVPHRWITVHSDRGHDSFLLQPELFAPHLRDTLINDWA